MYDPVDLHELELSLNEGENIIRAIEHDVLSSERKVKVENVEQFKDYIIKMVEGRLNKNLSEMCLVDQSFIKDPDQKVGKYIGNGKIEKMVRFLVGEGMQKREENFAEEVAAQMGK